MAFNAFLTIPLHILFGNRQMNCLKYYQPMMTQACAGSMYNTCNATIIINGQ